jgi:Uncharacterised protein family (UPF0236)
MTRKKTLKDYSLDQMQAEIEARWAKEHYRPGMTMSQMELLVWKARGMENPAAARSLAALLARMKREQPTGKPCPKCGKRTPVKVRDRDRTLRTMAGWITLKRNYHYCDACQYGFHPVDRLLDLPIEGELSSEMEKRVLDFGVNDVYGDGAARWNVHYQEPISDNLLRRVIARVGAQCESAEQGRLHEELKPREKEPAEVLVVEVDGSMLPIRGAEPWKEAKVGVIYRHDLQRRAPIPQSARYVAIVGGGMGEFAPVLEDALEVEDVDEARAVVCVGDGAPCNWNLADQLVPDATQILDWYHAVENAMKCAAVLLEEESPYLSLWKHRIEELLWQGEPTALINELMDCLPLVAKGRGGKEGLAALDALVRYYRNNAQRMRYRTFHEYGYPLGSGAVESAHRHVLQVRMKLAGQRWAMRNARRMARLRAAYRTGGPARFHAAIRKAHAETLSGRARRRGRRNHFRYARYGSRDLDRIRLAASN